MDEKTGDASEYPTGHTLIDMEEAKAKKREHPIPERMRARLSELHDVVQRCQRALGELRARYLREEGALFQQVNDAEREFGATAKNVILSADLDAKKSYQIDLKNGCVREE